jgi:hypothetical protein
MPLWQNSLRAIRHTGMSHAVCVPAHMLKTLSSTVCQSAKLRMEAQEAAYFWLTWLDPQEQDSIMSCWVTLTGRSIVVPGTCRSRSCRHPSWVSCRGTLCTWGSRKPGRQAGCRSRGVIVNHWLLISLTHQQLHVVHFRSICNTSITHSTCSVFTSRLVMPQTMLVIGNSLELLVVPVWSCSACLIFALDATAGLGIP